MTEAPRRSRVMRFLVGIWEVLKGLSVPVAACAAFFASLTALGVYEGERNRQQFDKLRHSYEMHYEFVKFVTAQRSLLPCYEALNELSDSELKAVLVYGFTKTFEFSPPQHGSLSECLIESVVGTKFPEQWGLTQTRSIRSAVMRRITAIDAPLLSYRQNVGDPGVICENFFGYIHGEATNKLLKRMIAADIIHAGNYPNLVHFFAKHGDKQPCPAIQLAQPKRNRILEWYENVLMGVEDAARRRASDNP